MNIHHQFDCSFMADRVATTLQTVESACTAAITDALNYKSGAMSARVQAMFPAAQLARVDHIISQLEALKARRAELQELVDEQAAEGGE